MLSKPVTVFVVLAIVISIGCSDSTENPVHTEEGEESNLTLSKIDTYDQVRAGARLILRYDANTQSFIGTVDNTTDRTLSQVRVEVHLSNGVELGPTPRKDLAPGGKLDVKLDATGQNFTNWSAHPEVG